MGQGQSSAQWHSQIRNASTTQIINGFDPTTPSETSYQLRWITDQYLKKKKKKLTAEDRDTKLLQLIQQHDDEQAAIIACAHAMSPEAVRKLLAAGLRISPGMQFNVERYLRAIQAAYQVNPKAVTDLEAQWAAALLPLVADKDHDAGRHIETCLSLPEKGIAPDLLRGSMVQGILRSAFAKFAARLEELTNECQWAQAYASASWLSIYATQEAAGLPGASDTVGKLNMMFKDWLMWARWRPNVFRI
ncbi:hypothetical protein BDY21DRAFT_282067, partial [Lineolata rhizophorae]